MTSTVTTTASATMQNSFTTMATPGLDIPVQAALAKQYGFDGVDLRVGEPGNGEIAPGISVSGADDVIAKLSGNVLSSLLCYNKTIHDGHEQMVSSLLACVNLAQTLNCGLIRIFTGKLSDATQVKELISILREALAKDNSSIRFGLQIHKNNGVSVVQAAQICDEISDVRIGIILSPDQSLLAGEKCEHLLPKIATRVFQVYVADIDINGEFTLIGDGIIDFSRIVGILCQHGFDGKITLKWEKCWYPQMPDYTVAFPSFIDYYNNKLLPLSSEKHKGDCE